MDATYVPLEVRRESQTPWNWSYRRCEPPDLVARKRSSGRKLQTTQPALSPLPLTFANTLQVIYLHTLMAQNK